jgi:uncharacterized protein (TIGR03435 family)
METTSQLRAITVLALAAGLSDAQTTSAAPAFDVASIKPSQLSGLREGGKRERIEAVPGSLIMGNVRFQTAVRWAYHVQEYQVTGPAWIGEERFDIVAKAGSPVPEEDLRLMLRTLLAERFQLGVHHQTKEMNAYVVTVGKNGHKLTESKTDGAMDVKPAGPMVATIQHADLDELASMLSQPLQAPVVNMTGLKGRYDFKIDMAPYITPELTSSRNPQDIIGVGITAMQEQLGLKMESKKIPVELVVIDRAEKSPIEN